MDDLSEARQLLRQWRRAYLDDIDDYAALNSVTDATTAFLGDRHPKDIDADGSLPVESSDSASERQEGK